LVADGDRALENGNTAKAQKMFEEALKIEPDGVAAVTGSGYLMLDKQRPLAAIGMFKRALANAPAFPQALFGLGEAYRSHGDASQAIDAYKNYLSVAPAGQDAPAARRQLRELETQVASSGRSETGTPGELPVPVPVVPAN
jgi:tetratricopeptide (TPR) repeat protein